LIYPATLLGIGGFLNGYDPGFWWSVFFAIASSFILTIITTCIGKLVTLAQLYLANIPPENRKFFLASSYTFSEKFGGTITIILVTEGIMRVLHLVGVLDYDGI